MMLLQKEYSTQMRSNLRFLDPKTDVTFKKVFGTERNQDILVHFLNDMFAYWNEPTITQVTLLPSMQLAEHKDQSTSVVDIMCQDELNRRFIVELQVRPHRGFLERVQFYSARAYAAQNQEKLIYEKLDPVITVVITDFDIFPHKAAYKSHHSTMDEETCENDLKAQRYVVMRGSLIALGTRASRKALTRALGKVSSKGILRVI